jgi:carbonic anhydrase/acetyltransferase-like protein (isoleucine patch superfamily)
MIITYNGKTPKIAPSAFVAPTAVIIGDVSVGEKASIWFGAVLRGDIGRIEVGTGTSIQDNVVIHTTADRPTVLKEEVTVGHGAILEACTVERRALVGMNAVILHNAVVGDEALVGAGSVVTDGTVIPARYVAAGVPAEIKKELSGSALHWIKESAPVYVQLSRTYLAQGVGVPDRQAHPRKHDGS